MYTFISHIKHTFYLVFIFTLALASCENDLREVERISSIQAEVPVDASYGVTIIYSDSATVKAKLTAPEMLHYNTEEPYYEFPKGGLLIFYDPNQEETQRVTAEYAIQQEKTAITELRKNVVATRADGLVVKSDELFWDENKRIFYSNKQVTLTRDGTVQTGTSFWSNEDFTSIEFTSLIGDLLLQGNQEIKK